MVGVTLDTGCWREKRSCSSLMAFETLAVWPKKSKSLPTGFLTVSVCPLPPKVSSLNTSSVSSNWSPRPSYVSSKSSLRQGVSFSFAEKVESILTYASSSLSGRESPANGSAACEKPGADVLWPLSRGRVESKPKNDMAFPFRL